MERGLNRVRQSMYKTINVYFLWLCTLWSCMSSVKVPGRTQTVVRVN